jgi:Tol biopolymer transport system component
VAPDGQSLLFLADAKGDENAQIFLLDLAADHVEALTDAPDAQHAAALGEPFSRDGMLLAYSANDRLPVEQDILIRDMAAGEVRRVPANGRRLSARALVAGRDAAERGRHAHEQRPRGLRGER